MALFNGTGCPICTSCWTGKALLTDRELGLAAQKNPIESRAWTFSRVILLFLPSIISLYWRLWVWTQVPNWGLAVRGNERVRENDKIVEQHVLKWKQIQPQPEQLRLLKSLTLIALWNHAISKGTLVRLELLEFSVPGLNRFGTDRPRESNTLQSLNSFSSQGAGITLH